MRLMKLPFILGLLLSFVSLEESYAYPSAKEYEEMRSGYYRSQFNQAANPMVPMSQNEQGDFENPWAIPHGPGWGMLREAPANSTESDLNIYRRMREEVFSQADIHFNAFRTIETDRQKSFYPRRERGANSSQIPQRFQSMAAASSLQVSCQRYSGNPELLANCLSLSVDYMLSSVANFPEQDPVNGRTHNNCGSTMRPQKDNPFSAEGCYSGGHGVRPNELAFAIMDAFEEPTLKGALGNDIVGTLASTAEGREALKYLRDNLRSSHNLDSEFGPFQGVDAERLQGFLTRITDALRTGIENDLRNQNPCNLNMTTAYENTVGVIPELEADLYEVMQFVALDQEEEIIPVEEIAQTVRGGDAMVKSSVDALIRLANPTPDANAIEGIEFKLNVAANARIFEALNIDIGESVFVRVERTPSGKYRVVLGSGLTTKASGGVEGLLNVGLGRMVEQLQTFEFDPRVPGDMSSLGSLLAMGSIEQLGATGAAIPGGALAFDAFMALGNEENPEEARNYARNYQRIMHVGIEGIRDALNAGGNALDMIGRNIEIMSENQAMPGAFDRFIGAGLQMAADLLQSGSDNTEGLEEALSIARFVSAPGDRWVTTRTRETIEGSVAALQKTGLVGVSASAGGGVGYTRGRNSDIYQLEVGAKMNFDAGALGGSNAELVRKVKDAVGTNVTGGVTFKVGVEDVHGNENTIDKVSFEMWGSVSSLQNIIGGQIGGNNAGLTGIIPSVPGFTRDPSQSSPGANKTTGNISLQASQGAIAGVKVTLPTPEGLSPDQAVEWVAQVQWDFARIAAAQAIPNFIPPAEVASAYADLNAKFAPAAVTGFVIETGGVGVTASTARSDGKGEGMGSVTAGASFGARKTYCINMRTDEFCP